MPLALAIIGIGLLVTAILNTWRCLGTQLASDLSGSGNFIYWIAALFIIGMLGYNKTLETPSRLLLTLIILSMFLANQGFFSQFLSALKSVKGTGGAQQPEGQVQSAAPILIQGSASSSSGVGSAVSSAISLGSKLL